MAIIEEAIATRITTDATITAICGTRAHPFKLPQNSAYPAMVFQCIDKIPAIALGTQATAFNARFQFDCYAKTPAAARALANALRKSLDALDTTLAGVRIYGTIFQSEFDVFEADTELYRISSDFKFLYTQT